MSKTSIIVVECLDYGAGNDPRESGQEGRGGGGRGRQGGEHWDGEGRRTGKVRYGEWEAGRVDRNEGGGEGEVATGTGRVRGGNG